MADLLTGLAGKRNKNRLFLWQIYIYNVYFCIETNNKQSQYEKTSTFHNPRDAGLSICI